MSSELLLPYRGSTGPAEEENFEKTLHSGTHTCCHEHEKTSHATFFPLLAWRNALHITLIICNISLLLFLVLRHVSTGCDNNLSSNYSPAESALRYNSTYFSKYGHLGGNPFSQPPGAALDGAWHQLLAGMNIVVSQSWLDPFGAKSVRLADNSGVLAQLGVYHELHCLKKLKRWNYRGHYYGKLSEAELKEEEVHIEHCLEWLRIAALCRSDITLTTFQWEGANNSRLATEYPIPRQCVDSERVLRWSEARAVDINKKGVLEYT